MIHIVTYETRETCEAL